MKQKKNRQNARRIQISNKLKSQTVFFKSFDDFLSKHGLYFLCSLIALIVFFVFKDFILLKKLFFFKDIGSDLINNAYPFSYSLADYIVNEGFPKWSFNVGMGQNIMPFSINPFSLFTILLGKDLVYYTIFFAEIFKIICAGIFFYLFLKKNVISDYTAIIGATLYSFSGFIIIGIQCITFSAQAVYVALLLYAFEKLYQDDNWIIFPVSIFLIALNQPTDLYFIGFFLPIYIILRLLEAPEKKVSRISNLFLKIVFLGLLGVAMSSFFLLNGLHIMLESPRVSGDASFFNVLFSKPVFGLEGNDYGNTHYLTALMRFFSCDMLGHILKYRGWYNYGEAPLFYCGLFSLMLFPHFISLSDKRKKIAYIVLILLFILPVIFPFFRYAFWLFTGNYYRIFSFFVAMVILLIGLKSLDDIDRQSAINIKIIWGTLLFLLLILYYPYNDAQIIDKNIRNIAAGFLIIYSTLLYFLQFKSIKNVVKIILLSVIVIELVYFSSITFNKRPVILSKEITQRIGYNDYTIDALAFIKSGDITFYRIHKDYYSSPGRLKGLNDAMAQEFYGTSSYYSFNQLNYIKFLQTMGIINEKDELATRCSIGLTKSPLLHSFASIKYALSKESNSYLLKFGYDLRGESFGNVKVLKNKFVLPLGFTYEKYISLSDFKTLSQNQKMIALYKAVVIDDRRYNHFGHLSKLSLNDTPENYWDNEHAKDIEYLKQSTLTISKHGQNNITGDINADKDKILFFSIPFDKGWHVKIDGKEISPLMVNIGFIGVPITKGVHHIELSFTPLFFYTGAVISIIAIILFIALVTFRTLNVTETKKC